MRGLTQNVAGWDHDISSRTPSAVADQLVAKIEKAPRWNLVRQAVSGDSTVIFATRTTRVFRFTDDVRVELSGRADGSTHLHASSRSRIGKGDLGQNSRNLKQLAGWLKKSS